jgi:hypothetical protein
MVLTLWKALTTLYRKTIQSLMKTRYIFDVWLKLLYDDMLLSLPTEGWQLNQRPVINFI